MSRIHSEQLVTHQERESVLRFEVERLKREVESAQLLSEREVNGSDKRVQTMKKELNELRRICNENQLHTNSHKQRADLKVEKARQEFMKEEEKMRNTYLTKINKLQQQLAAKNKLVHHVNNLLRQERYQQQESLQTTTSQLCDQLRLLQYELQAQRQP